jgi:acyl CoA:acetate/3-ketoacid CoA transferase alpha subunit
VHVAGSTDKVGRLDEVIAARVRPGDHLHFASTPSRSNAAVVALGRAFAGRDPRFVLSGSGFHSVLHLLARLRLGREYLACFFGDNYPVPRPNALYTRLRDEGAILTTYSLATYVAAFRAGALGEPWAVTRSLVGSDLGAELARAGRFAEVPDPDGAALGLVRAVRADLCFVHAPAAEPDGTAVFSAPFSEGFGAALGARRGVVLTTERIVPPRALAAHRDAQPIPRDRVIAVCEEPFGAHPQPFFTAARLEGPSYGDDFDHYELWRRLATDDEAFARFEEQVLGAPVRAAGYQAWVGPERLLELVASDAPERRSSRPRAPASTPPPLTPHDHRRASHPDGQVRPVAIQVVLAARAIAAAVRRAGYRRVLAGIGHSYLASRLARVLLAEEGVRLEVMVETGLDDVDCGPGASDFLLAHDTIRRSRRLTAVDDVLGVQTCGADARCLGVVGAAQIDTRGAINTSRAGDKLLVGSGGANDIASCADEVIVLSRCSRSRMVPRVEFVTSPGRAVRTVVTELATFWRASSDDEAWSIGELYPSLGGRPVPEAIAEIRESCGWDVLVDPEIEYGALISSAEMMSLHQLDRDGRHFERAR